MPSIFTLEGTSQASLSDAGDNFLLAWLRRQNPLVAGVTVLGLSIGTGFVVSSIFIAGINRAKKSMGR